MLNVGLSSYLNHNNPNLIWNISLCAVNLYKFIYSDKKNPFHDIPFEMYLYNDLVYSL